MWQETLEKLGLDWENFPVNQNGQKVDLTQVQMLTLTMCSQDEKVTCKEQTYRNYFGV